MKKIIRMAIVCTLAGAALLTGCTKDYSQDINAVDQKVNALSTEVNNLIANLEPRVGSLEAALPALKNTVEAGYKAADEALQKGFTAEANAIKESVKTLQDNVTALSKDLAAQKTALADLEKAYKAGDEATLAAAKAAAEAGDAVLQKNIDAANANIAALQNEAATIKAAVAENTEAINALQESAKESAKALESLKAAVKALADQIQSISVIPDNVMGIAAAHVMFAELTEADKEVSRITPKVTLNVDVEPAELAGTITTENAVLRTVISDGFSCPVNDLPVEIVEAENNGLAVTATLSEDFLKAYEELSEKAFGAWNFSVALVVKNANVVDGVDLGSYVASDYAQASFGVSPANRFVEVFPAIYVEEKDKFYYKEYTNSIKVPWNEYRNSTRNLFDGVQVGYVAYAGYEQEAFMTPEEVAAMFDKDVETLKLNEKTVNKNVEGNLKVKEDGWDSTAEVDASKVKKDDEAKALANKAYATLDLNFSVRKDNKTIPVSGLAISSKYLIVNKAGGVVTVDPVSFVWDFTKADVSETVKEVASSDAKKAVKAGDFRITYVNEDGETVDAGGAEVQFKEFKATDVASKIVDYYVHNVAFREVETEYQVEGTYPDEKAKVDYPVTSSFTVSAMPEKEQIIDLGVIEVAGSETAEPTPSIAPLAKTFGGNEALYIGKSGKSKDQLYASLAKGEVVDKLSDNYTKTYEPNAKWTLIADGDKVEGAKAIKEIIPSVEFAYKVKNGKYSDKSSVQFAAGKVGYGKEFILTFPVTTPWGITYTYKAVFKSATLETALVPSGFIQDGKVTVGGATGKDGMYTINAIKMYSYFTLNTEKADPADFKVELTYKTAAGNKFDKFLDPNNKDDKKAIDANAKAGCSDTPTGIDEETTVYTFDEYGALIPATKDFTWAPYGGLEFTVSAQLLKKKDDTKVGSPLVFKVVTPDPIQKVVWGGINDTRKLNVKSTVSLYQNVEVYGCLDAEKNLVCWKPEVPDTKNLPWATTKIVAKGTDPETYEEVLEYAKGNQIYGTDQDFVFNNYDEKDNPAKVYVNGVEQRASDIIEKITGYNLVIKSVSAAGKYTFEIPATLVYEGGFKKTGVVIVNIDFK